MNILSYYCRCNPNEHFQAWERDIGVGLPLAIAELSQSTVNLFPITEESYRISNDFSDISYCQLFAIPKIRPENFIYTFLSDYIGNEGRVRKRNIRFFRSS